jgi:hypothetical protein
LLWQNIRLRCQLRCFFIFFIRTSTFFSIKRKSLFVFKSSDGTTELTLQCDRQQNKLISQLDTAKLATKEMTFKQQKIQAREGQLNTGKSMVGFTIRNPINNEFVLFNLNKNLYPLIEKTLQFE